MVSVANRLGVIQHIVVLMMADRSFDHMLGFLYPGNVSPSGQPFEGLTGTESNPGSSGQRVTVFQIDPVTPSAYFMPGASAGHGYAATNSQLYGNGSGPSSAGQPATCLGFVANYAATLRGETSQPRPVVPGTGEGDIMGCFTPQALPVLSALASQYAVCDQWFASVPAETLPNRAFACAATSQGHMTNGTAFYPVQSIFGLMTAHGLRWRIYGYAQDPLTRQCFPDTVNAPDSNFGVFGDFQADAAAGTLPAYTFLEPSWGPAGNSQLAPYDVAAGEQLIHDVYRLLRSGPGWPGTLLIITYDGHGGCYDHVPPPWGAVPPDTSAGQFGFGFDRFGVRVPAVLVSPLIAPGTVYRVPAGGIPLDHTSILKTVEQRWNLPALTARDAAASAFGDVLTLAMPRTDDVLAGLTVPVSSGPGPVAGTISHLESVKPEPHSGQEPRGISVPAQADATLPADGGGQSQEKVAPGFNVLAVRSYEDGPGHTYLYPGLGEHYGQAYAAEPADGDNVSMHPVSGADVYEPDRGNTLARTPASPALYVTDCRVVLSREVKESERRKDLTEIGIGLLGPVGTAVGSALFAVDLVKGAHEHHARHTGAVRRKGKVLVGHIRYEWIKRIAVSPTPTKGPLGPTVALEYTDGETTKSLRLHLRRRDVEAPVLAQDIVRRAAAFRLRNNPGLAPDQRAVLEQLIHADILRLPPEGWTGYDLPASQILPQGELPTRTPALNRE